MAKIKSNAPNSEDLEIKEFLVSANRVAKVVKGGRIFRISAMVIAGHNGTVGFGYGKAKEMPEARAQASKDAKKNMKRVFLKEGRTIHHDVIGKYGSGKVILRSAKPGTGIIAGGAMRAIFDALGIQDIVAKSVGSSNVHNMIRATFDALDNLSSPKNIAEKRNKKIGEIIERRDRKPSKKVEANG